MGCAFLFVVIKLSLKAATLLSFPYSSIRIIVASASGNATAMENLHRVCERMVRTMAVVLFVLFAILAFEKSGWWLLPLAVLLISGSVFGVLAAVVVTLAITVDARWLLALIALVLFW